MSSVFPVRSHAMLCALSGLAALVALGCDQDTPDADAGSDAGTACTGDEACDDGVFCNGVERCVTEQCTAGTAPCAAALCDESAGTCDSDCDVDGDGQDAIACGGGDCDDEDAGRAPGNTEVCDAADVDEDCDPTTFGARDADGDGYASSACCNVATDGTRHCGDDCDDARAGANPVVPEVCDVIDNDCDGAIDEAVLVRCFIDEDGDGYALISATSVDGCVCPVRTTIRPPSDADDCDDTQPAVSPGLPEICENGRDDDCDDGVDEAGNDWYRDCDGDGVGTGTAIRACASPGTPVGCPGGGHELRGDDCDDASAIVYPDAPEQCDGIRNDCTAAAADGPEGTAWCNSPIGPAPAPNVASTLCMGGFCAFERCVTGFLDCAADRGCETDGRADSENCGVCGGRCVDWGGAGCAASLCTAPLELSAGRSHTCALGRNGAVDCWGFNGDGRLGDGSTTNRLIPTPVAGLVDAVEIAAGDTHACARRASGAVVCWGKNDEGQLGDGTRTDRLTPTAVSGLTDAVELSLGDRFTCARRAAGTVVCWGYNEDNQLGDGTSANRRLVPVAVVGLTDAVEVSAGGAHACARRASGAVACWGRNVNGEVGDGTTSTSRLTPTAATGLTDAVELSAGVEHTCARRGSGAVVCWGRNVFGRLGDGTAVDRSSPTPVSGLTDAVGLSAGGRHTCARRTSGAVVCWGDNERGQLGDGTTTVQLAPASVAGLTDAVEIRAGGTHTCARRASAAVACWGWNAEGQLGDGTTTDRLIPTAIPPAP